MVVKQSLTTCGGFEHTLCRFAGGGGGGGGDSLLSYPEEDETHGLTRRARRSSRC